MKHNPPFAPLTLFILSLLTNVGSLTPVHAGGRRPLANVTYVPATGQIEYFLRKGPERPFRVLFLADLHFTVEDRRGLPYIDYTRRMGGSAVEPENYGRTNGRESGLLSALEQARTDSVDLVILGGDILNFPSQASVEWITRTMDSSGLEWCYIAGNHDWHYEGEPGKADNQRDRWTRSNLAPLYQGADPMGYSRVVNGVNFLMIDNSTNEILPQQLALLKRELRRGLPIVLCVHVPLYMPGTNIDYSCGSPEWNQANDIYYEIERREPWPAEGHTATTYEFCRTIWESPQVIGILAGHTHEQAIGFRNDKPQFVPAAAYQGATLRLHFQPAPTRQPDPAR